MSKSKTTEEVKELFREIQKQEPWSRKTIGSVCTDINSTVGLKVNTLLTYHSGARIMPEKVYKLIKGVYFGIDQEDEIYQLVEKIKSGCFNSGEASLELYKLINAM